MRKVLEGAGLRHFHSPFSPSPCSGVMAFLVWEEGKTRRAGDDDDNDDSNVLMPVCHVKTTTRWTHCRRFAGRDIRAFERNTTSGSLTTFAEMPRGQTLRREANWAKPRSKTTRLRVEKECLHNYWQRLGCKLQMSTADERCVVMVWRGGELRENHAAFRAVWRGKKLVDADDMLSLTSLCSQQLELLRRLTWRWAKKHKKKAKINEKPDFMTRSMSVCFAQRGAL